MPFVKYCLLCKEELKIFRKPTQSVDFTVTGPEMYSKQAEAEVVPSSSLAEVEFEVEVGVEVDVGVEVGVEVGVDVGVEVEVGVGAWGVMVGAGLTFSVGWVGGWRFGE